MSYLPTAGAVSLHASVIDTLTRWRAPDPAQDTLRHAVLAFVTARPDACRRACEPGHITASTLLVDHTGTHALLTLHPRVGRWLQLGGHCEDEDTDITAAALREAAEESGITGVRVDPELLAVHVHPLTCSLGVPTRHLDLQFLAHAPAGAEFTCSDESLDLRWWPLEAIPAGDPSLDALVGAARARIDAQAKTARKP